MSESIILLIFGGIFLIIGVVVFAQTFQKRRRCNAVTAGVVKAVRTKRQTEDSGKDKKAIFRTTVEFSVGDKTYIKDAIYGSTMNAHYVGEKIDIHYNPEDPNQAYWGTSDFLGIFSGVLFGVVGLGLIIVSLFV